MDSRRHRLAPVLLIVVTACAPIAPPTTSVAPAASVPAHFDTDVDRMRADLVALQEAADANGGIRTAGTPGYEASVDHVASVLREIGFAVETPTVEFTGFRQLPGARLQVGDATFEGSEELRALIYSPGGEVDGPVAVLDESGCDPGDFARVQAGAVVLTTGGGCLRRQQAMNAAEAGAAAMLVGYPGRNAGEIFRPTLLDPGGIEIPVVSVTDAAVRALQRARTASLSVTTELPDATFRNVVAKLGNGAATVMIGAHLDSVLDGPGINDNASGVAAVLELARIVAATGLPDGWSLRIGLWGAEEFGTIGSRAYAETLDGGVVAYLNLDMAGSVNGATLIYDEPDAAPGSMAITEAYEAWLDARGEESARADLGGSSDHYGFIQAGIPTGGLFAGASESGSASSPAGAPSTGDAMDPCYHIACDTIDNVDVDRVALFAEATLAVAYGLMDAGP